jgi:hypothetical protein
MKNKKATSILTRMNRVKKYCFLAKELIEGRLGILERITTL